MYAHVYTRILQIKYTTVYADYQLGLAPRQLDEMRHPAQMVSLCTKQTNLAQAALTQTVA